MNKRHQALKHARRKRQHPANRRARKIFAGFAAFFVLAGLAVFTHKDKLDMTGVIFRGSAAPLDVEISAGARGNIYDRNFKLLAGMYQTTAIYARPLEMVDLQLAANKIAPLLGLSEENLLNTLKSERAFVWLGRKVSPERAEEIQTFNLVGIYLVEEMNRTYPNKNIAAHALGYVSKNKGLDGIEFYYDSILSGGVADVSSLPTSLDAADVKSLQEKGGDLRLTLDLAIQTRIEDQLAQVIIESGAESGVAMAMDPDSGAILAMASHPYFDPNQFWNSKEEARVNRVISSAVFPPIPALPVSATKEGAPAEQTKIKSRHRLLTPLKFKKTITQQPVQRVSAIRIDESPFFLAGKHITRLGRPVDLPSGPIFAGRPATDRASATNINLSPRTATPLTILTSFTSLADQGRAITPHLLSGILIPAKEKLISNSLVTNPEHLFAPDTGNRIWQEMLGNAIPGPSDSLFFEYIDTRDENEGAGSDKKSLEDDKMVAGSIDHRYHRLLLGVAPQSKPEIAFLMAVNFGTTNAKNVQGKDTATSPLLSMGKKEIGKILKIARATPPPPSSAFWNQENRIAAAPAQAPKAKRSKTIQPVNKPEKAIMPSIAGKSLRHGLQAIQHIEARVKIIGSGLIVEQQPRAGARITKGELCILKLEHTL